MEEFVKFTDMQRSWSESFGDRFSERKERRVKKLTVVEAAAKEKDVVDNI